MPDYHMTRKAELAMEASFRNDRESHELLDLIDREFRTDPTSVQCFDRRIVERVALCVARRKAYLKAVAHLVLDAMRKDMAKMRTATLNTPTEQ